MAETNSNANKGSVSIKAGQVAGVLGNITAIQGSYNAHTNPNSRNIDKINADMQTTATLTSAYPPVAIATNSTAAVGSVYKILYDNQQGNQIDPRDVTAIGGNVAVVAGSVAVVLGAPLVGTAALVAGTAYGLYLVGQYLYERQNRDEQNPDSNSPSTDPTTPSIDPITPPVPTPENPVWTSPFPLYPLSPENWKGAYWDDGSQCLAPWVHDPNWSRSNEYHIVDPLVLDLNGDGIKTVAQNGYHGAMFDFNANGIQNATGWISKEDGLLVLDRNKDGIINNGTELFGDTTPIGKKTAENGFAALASLDTNKDGKITAQDKQFAQLKIWQDLNGDGVSQKNELKTLKQLGITELNLDYKESNLNLGNGNTLTHIGSFVRKAVNDEFLSFQAA